jgi:hypothetical protein
VRVGDRPGGGAVFTLAFPIVVAPEAAEEPEFAPAK